jgi:peptidoglycan/xylan/chitin deacetylase (PgdA/CDA1 family)
MNPWAIGLPGAAAAAAAYALGGMSPSSQLFGPVIRRLPPEGPGNRMALTFDDGPNPAATPRLLDLLERFDARATFFVIGRFARACPELILEIVARGHVLGNHTETHPNLMWLTRAKVLDELCRCEGSVMKALAEVAAGPLDMKYMRPPYGYRGPNLRGVAKEMKLEGVATWSLICYDWKPQPPSRLIERLARARARDIVVLHDGDHRALNGERDHVLIALEHWLPRWRDAGLEFVTMDAAKRAAQ